MLRKERWIKKRFKQIWLLTHGLGGHFSERRLYNLNDTCKDLQEAIESRCSNPNHRLNLRFASRLINGAVILNQKNAENLVDDCKQLLYRINDTYKPLNNDNNVKVRQSCNLESIENDSNKSEDERGFETNEVTDIEYNTSKVGDDNTSLCNFNITINYDDYSTKPNSKRRLSELEWSYDSHTHRKTDSNKRSKGNASYVNTGNRKQCSQENSLNEDRSYLENVDLSENETSFVYDRDENSESSRCNNNNDFNSLILSENSFDIPIKRARQNNRDEVIDSLNRMKYETEDSSENSPEKFQPTNQQSINHEDQTSSEDSKNTRDELQLYRENDENCSTNSTLDVLEVNLEEEFHISITSDNQNDENISLESLRRAVNNNILDSPLQLSRQNEMNIMSPILISRKTMITRSPNQSTSIHNFDTTFSRNGESHEKINMTYREYKNEMNKVRKVKIKRNELITSTRYDGPVTRSRARMMSNSASVSNDSLRFRPLIMDLNKVIPLSILIENGQLLKSSTVRPKKIAVNPRLKPETLFRTSHCGNNTKLRRLFLRNCHMKKSKFDRMVFIDPSVSLESSTISHVPSNQSLEEMRDDEALMFDADRFETSTPCALSRRDFFHSTDSNITLIDQTNHSSELNDNIREVDKGYSYGNAESHVTIRNFHESEGDSYPNIRDETILISPAIIENVSNNDKNEISLNVIMEHRNDILQEITCRSEVEVSESEEDIDSEESLVDNDQLSTGVLEERDFEDERLTTILEDSRESLVTTESLGLDEEVQHDITRNAQNLNENNRYEESIMQSICNHDLLPNTNHSYCNITTSATQTNIDKIRKEYFKLIRNGCINDDTELLVFNDDCTHAVSQMFSEDVFCLLFQHK